ncbi:MAG: cytochrome P450 [Actinomycetota bacterium]
MVDLESPESIGDPARYFARMADAGPVQWSEALRAWVVLDHAGVSAAFRDSERLSADRIGPLERVAAQRPAAFGKVVELLRGWMVFRDPPHHTRLRAPVRNAFTPRRVEDLTDVVAGVVDDVVGRLQPGPVDVRREFADPLPALVIAAVLGVEGDDRHSFQRWSDDLATVVFSTTPASMPSDAAIDATEEFQAFFGRLIERERARPSGSLLSQLITEADDDLSALELVGACTLLLFAGHETTASLLANTVGLFLERPDLLQAARRHPSGDAVMVEELLRVLGPTRTMFRKAAVDHERGGRQLRAGDTVALAMCAANHDPLVFDRPGVIEFTRDPNPHLTFGWGLHHCVGAHLARLEARLALRALLDRFGTIRAVGPVPPMTGTVLGYAREPITAELRH